LVLHLLDLLRDDGAQLVALDHLGDDLEDEGFDLGAGPRHRAHARAGEIGGAADRRFLDRHHRKRAVGHLLDHRAVRQQRVGAGAAHHLDDMRQRVDLGHDVEIDANGAGKLLLELARAVGLAGQHQRQLGELRRGDRLERHAVGAELALPVVGGGDEEHLFGQQRLQRVGDVVGRLVDAAEIEPVGVEPLDDVARHRFGNVQLDLRKLVVDGLEQWHAEQDAQ